MKCVLGVIAVIVLSACSSGIEVNRVADDDSAKGLRYFPPARMQMAAYEVTIPPGLPKKPDFDQRKTIRIERIGDVLNAVVPDEARLSEVQYNGAIFASDTVSLEVNENGTVSRVGLAAAAGSVTPAAGSLAALKSAAEVRRDFDKVADDARIAELKREADLIKAKDELDKLLDGR